MIKERINHLLRIAICFIACSWSIVALAASDTSSLIYSKAHQEVLSKYREDAVNYCAKNLNKFGLYELQKYNTALDSLYKKELDDTLKAFQIHYQNAHMSRNIALDSLSKEIKKLANQKELAQTKFNQLLKKAGIAFLIWLAIILILILIRSRTLKKALVQLDKSKLMLMTSDLHISLGKELLEFTKSQEGKTDLLKQMDSDLQKWMNENPLTTIDKFLKEKADLIQNKIKTIHDTNLLNQNLISTVSLMENEAGSEKVVSNLNQICDQCLDAVYYGIKSKDEEFNCVISKDLEKNLPLIKIIPEAIVYLLLNVLDNSFRAVYEKHKQNMKGYVPKVSISTRVLPRFLQIRIKDNGNGMNDDGISRIYESFYTTRIPEEGAGLGMFYAGKIVSDLHAGEIKIESRVGDGTDVYLKFFTS